MVEDEQLRRELIIASAFLHTSPPPDYIRANSHRVLRHALMAAGLWEDSHTVAFNGLEDLDENPVVWRWYKTLVDLAREQPASARLLEGAGNLTLPAGPFFTACWCTPAGEAAAKRILEDHPEWEAALRNGPPRTVRRGQGWRQSSC